MYEVRIAKMKYIKYLGYLILVLAVIAGYKGLPILAVLVLALLSTVVFASSRRKTFKNTPMAPDKNMFLDGMFLFISQILIVWMFYLLGTFGASDGGALFVDWMSGTRPPVDTPSIPSE